MKTWWRKHGGGRQSSPGRRGTKTRDLILRTAAKLLKQLGYRRISAKEIAAAAGIGKATVYLYLPSIFQIQHVDIEKKGGRLG